MSGECERCGNHPVDCTGEYCCQANNDMIDHPTHYKGTSLEVIDIIEDFHLDFCLGNAIKYILRCDKKGRKIEDLKKAIWYLERSIKGLE